MAPVVAINEPFLLSSYSANQHAPKSRSKTKNQRIQPGVFASYQKPSATSEGFVTIAAQSDGVHIVDVATLHPIISHTLSPLTSFACAPLTLYESSNKTHTTFAAVASSPDVGVEYTGRTIWKWNDNLSTPPADRSSSSEPQPFVVPHLVTGLFHCDDLPSRFFAISHAGDISLLTTDLELKSNHSSSGEETNVIATHVFSTSSCSFVGSQAEGATIILVLEDNTSVRVQVSRVTDDDSIQPAFVHQVPLTNTRILAASCSSSGIINIITSVGSWHTFCLTPSTITPISPAIQLHGLPFTSSPSSTSSIKGAEAQMKNTLPLNLSILPLTSSHILFASQTSQDEIALLLWDSQYSVLLASHLLPLPPSLSTQTSPLILSILSTNAASLKAGNQQAVLIASQSIPDADRKSSVKSNIYIVPYSVPAKSTLANAIGRTTASARWLANSKENGKDAPPYDTARAKLVADIRKAVEQNRIQIVNALFKEWELKEQARIKDGSVEMVMFNYTFVKNILEAIIQPQKPPSLLYSSEVVRHLLEKGVVCSAMIETGLLAALRLRDDWSSIDLVLRYVPDLSENELIETLNAIIDRTSSEVSTADPDTMQIDTTPSKPDQLPSLPGFLKAMLEHRQFTTSQLIAAIRRHLRSAEALTLVAHLLDDWLKKWQSQEVKLLPSRKDIAKNEHGVFVVKDMVKPKSRYDLPPVEQILNFVQCLLDASFLTLLQHRPAHKVLESLRSHIEPEIAALSQVEQLRGLVEGFARAHAKTIRDAETGAVAGDNTIGAVGKEGSKRDWRQRRKETHEQVGLSIGVYQMEELVL